VCCYSSFIRLLLLALDVSVNALYGHGGASFRAGCNGFHRGWFIDAGPALGNV
jgi:hypothetical protein